MKKLILAASALALGTAASANEHDHDMTDEEATAQTAYDDVQPQPLPSNPEVDSQQIANFDVEMRETYPICDGNIRDNCVQRFDPGGSNLDLANEGTLGVNGVTYGVGGPEEDKDW